ncbi:MAG: hypothetical protein ACR2MZ_03095 [Candidatus Dormibacter sp.]|uniref:hypothetical protein n=1 Tax=Candidatus Dormibacter sp. TaxID=2973982 RepID=UPI000DB35146|nr:MAG: hypothetical protein DLM66_05230 [Candidatus Dormibacteraeota bacterium]
MTVSISVRLLDAIGATPIGGGSWRLAILDNGKPVYEDQTNVAYTGGVLTATASVNSWTHLVLSVTPGRYAAAGVTLNRSTIGAYRDDPLTVVRKLELGAVDVDLPLLRLREAPGVSPDQTPTVGKELTGPWLRQRPPTEYRELSVTDWLTNRSPVRRVMDVTGAKGGVIGDADADAWDRFNTRNNASIPRNAGAGMLLEYGEVGSLSAAGARFLVGMWAPARADTTRPPTWRDIVAFIHPSTAKPWYPVVAYPFRRQYPYAVGENTQVPAADPDRIYQPYAHLAHQYIVGAWVHYHRAGNEAVIVTPIFPNPPDKDPDRLEYGLPFRTTSGMARLAAEVNMFLHRLGYGFSGFGFDRWWGAASIAPPHFSSIEVPAPAVRKVAMAAYSASTTQLDTLLSGQELREMRYPSGTWGVPDAVNSAFAAQWQETWCLDLLTGKATVPAATVERHLNDWVTANSGRRFVMGGSGTTGGSDPGALYPALSKASTRVTGKSSSEPARSAEVWHGPDGKWLALFCTNKYLSAAAAQGNDWPRYPVNPTDDEAHGFMFQIASGLAWGWTAVGNP